MPENIQYHLSKEIRERVEEQAQKANLSPNEFAKGLLLKSLSDQPSSKSLEEVKKQLQNEKLRLECALLQCKIDSYQYQNGVKEHEQAEFNREADHALEQRIEKERINEKILETAFTIDTKEGCFKCVCGNVNFSGEGAIKHFEAKHADQLKAIQDQVIAE